MRKYNCEINEETFDSFLREFFTYFSLLFPSLLALPLFLYHPGIYLREFRSSFRAFSFVVRREKGNYVEILFASSDSGMGGG